MLTILNWFRHGDIINKNAIWMERKKWECKVFPCRRVHSGSAGCRQGTATRVPTHFPWWQYLWPQRPTEAGHVMNVLFNLMCWVWDVIAVCFNMQPCCPWSGRITLLSRFFRLMYFLPHLCVSLIVLHCVRTKATGLVCRRPKWQHVLF